ncbi:hypothetical protein NIIDMKKI_54600 [Mycobacterium kansasii]|uniref:Uncharacterized protein n=1 Tax=Mycobacterium kansasii TaxID=1768 RepID=A0A7G1IIH8_MYCKA|nr:hypothetical protein NIIDMKKI_54600 [Mycobacterium kansasii]
MVFGELAPACGVGVGPSEGGVEAGVDEVLEDLGAVGVLFGAGDAGVGGIDAVGGAKDGDFGHQRGALTEQWACPGRCGGRLPRAGGGAYGVGEFGDQFGSRGEVGTPLGVGV